MRVLISALLLCALVSTINTTKLNTGLGVGLSQHTVESFKVLIPGILEKLEGVPLPDITLDGINVTDLTISSFKMEVADLHYGSPSPNVAELQISKLNLGLSFNFNGKVLLIPFTGHCDALSEDTTMDTKVTVGNNDGKLTLDVTTIGVVINTLNVHLSGNLGDKIMNALVKLFHTLVKDTVNKEMNDMLKTKAAGIVDKALAAIPPYVALGVVPLSFTTDITTGPTINDEYIAFGLESRVVPTENTDLPEDVPPAKPMPTWLEDGEQTQLFVNDFALNSGMAALSYLHTNFTITGEMLPASLPISLDATNFENLFPGISEKYGRNTPLAIELILDDHPDQVTFTTAGINLDLGAELKFKVDSKVKADQTTIVDMRVGIAGVVTLDVEDEIIKIAVPVLTATSARMLSCTLDPAPTNADLMTDFKALMELAQQLASVLIPSSMAMPTPEGISLHDTKITTQNGYLLLETTPNFDSLKGFESAQQGVANFWYDVLHGSLTKALEVLLKNSFGF